MQHNNTCIISRNNHQFASILTLQEISLLNIKWLAYGQAEYTCCDYDCFNSH